MNPRRRRAADDVTTANLLADGGHGGLNEMRRGPVARRSADLETKFLMIREPSGVWCTSGWNCTAQMRPLLVGDAGQGVGADGDAVKAGGQFERFVAVAHPYLECRRQAGEERRRAVFDADFGMTIFAQRRRQHLAA